MRRVLQISLALNLILLIAVGWRRTGHKPLPGAAQTESQQQNNNSEQIQISRQEVRLQKVTAWQQLENADPHSFIENLRSIGCPEQTIREIVTLRVAREYRSRLLQVESGLIRDLDYTKPNRDHWMERNERSRDLRDEMITKLESLFGQSWHSLLAQFTGGETWGADPLETFSMETRRKIREVEKRYRREEDQLSRRRATVELTLQDLARCRELEREKFAALATVLSPNELQEYFYRNSPAADYVRRNLPEAKSEQEFRSLVQLAAQMEVSEGSVPTYRNLTPFELMEEVQREVEQRKTEFDLAVKELLGQTRVAEQAKDETERAAALQKEQYAQDEALLKQELSSLAAEVGVSAELVSQFYDRMKQSEALLNAKLIEFKKTLTGTPEEIREQMKTAAKAEIENTAVEIMGEKGRAFIQRWEQKSK